MGVCGWFFLGEGFWCVRQGFTVQHLHGRLGEVHGSLLGGLLETCPCNTGGFLLPLIHRAVCLFGSSDTYPGGDIRHHSHLWDHRSTGQL